MPRRRRPIRNVARYFSIELNRKRRSKTTRSRAAIQQRFREKVFNENSAKLRELKDQLTGLKDQERTKVSEAMARTQTEATGSSQDAGPGSEVVALKNEIEAALEKAGSDPAHRLLKVDDAATRVSVCQNAIVPGSRRLQPLQQARRRRPAASAFLRSRAAANFREFRWRKNLHRRRCSRGLGLALIGSVPELPDSTRSRSPVRKVDPMWQNQLIESVDTIRTLLLRSARANSTPSSRAERRRRRRKTTLASQLA